MEEPIQNSNTIKKLYTHISIVIQLCLCFNDFFKHLYHQTKHLGHEKIFISNSMDFEVIGRRHVQCYDFSDAGAVETVCSSAYINQLLQGNGKKT